MNKIFKIIKTKKVSLKTCTCIPINTFYANNKQINIFYYITGNVEENDDDEIKYTHIIYKSL